MTRPVSDLRGPVRALFSDVDGTMTTGDRIEASTYEALERLGEAGVPVIMVTGRSAGFAHAAMKMTSVPVVVSENGGVTFVREGKRLHKLYGVPQASLPEWRRRMNDIAVEVLSKVPAARLSSDSRYREVDLAIDWNERLAVGDAKTCVQLFQGGVRGGAVSMRELRSTALRQAVCVHARGPAGAEGRCERSLAVRVRR
jgi:hypothetical protein